MQIFYRAWATTNSLEVCSAASSLMPCCWSGPSYMLAAVATQGWHGWFPRTYVSTHRHTHTLVLVSSASSRTGLVPIHHMPGTLSKGIHLLDCDWSVLPKAVGGERKAWHAHSRQMMIAMPRRALTRWGYFGIPRLHSVFFFSSANYVHTWLPHIFVHSITSFSLSSHTFFLSLSLPSVFFFSSLACRFCLLSRVDKRKG